MKRGEKMQITSKQDLYDRIQNCILVINEMERQALALPDIVAPQRAALLAVVASHHRALAAQALRTKTARMNRDGATRFKEWKPETFVMNGIELELLK